MARGNNNGWGGEIGKARRRSQSEKMLSRWRDGQFGRPFKGGTASKISPGRRQLTILVDEETCNILASRALKKNTSVSELVRTYIEWGLDTDE